jgi:hypothetical protein
MHLYIGVDCKTTTAERLMHSPTLAKKLPLDRSNAL